MPIDIQALARHGAIARLQELQQEAAEIMQAFPDLRAMHRADGNGLVTFRTLKRRVKATRRNVAALAQGQAEGTRRRKPMTAAQRKAVGERMRKYWAARRKAEKD